MYAESTLQSHESELTGTWRLENGHMIADATCQRIQWLIDHVLKKVTDSPDSGGWETLFQDRYCERVYPQSEMHGGGPPRLHALTLEEVEGKYRIA
jgi:hypothetical protein